MEGYLEGSSGLPNKIIWRDDLLFDSEKEAQEYIDKESRKKSYLQIAVRYKVPKKGTKKQQELEERIDRAQEKIDIENRKMCNFPYRNRKSKTKTCKKCGSTMNVNYIGNTRCPLCGNDMRTNTEKERRKRLSDNLAKARKELEIYNKELAKKNYEEWYLLKYEYHV